MSTSNDYEDDEEKTRGFVKRAYQTHFNERPFSIWKAICTLPR